MAAAEAEYAWRRRRSSVAESTTWWSSASMFSFHRPFLPSLGTGPAGLLCVACCCDQKRPPHTGGDSNVPSSARKPPVALVTEAASAAAMPGGHNTGSPVGQTGASPDHCLRSLTDIGISLPAPGDDCVRAGGRGKMLVGRGPDLGTSAWCTQWPRSVGVDEEHASDETASFKDWTRRRSGAWKG